MRISKRKISRSWFDDTMGLVFCCQKSRTCRACGWPCFLCLKSNFCKHYDLISSHMCLAVLMIGSAVLDVTTLLLFRVIKILKSLKSWDFWFQEACLPLSLSVFGNICFCARVELCCLFTCLCVFKKKQTKHLELSHCPVGKEKAGACVCMRTLILLRPWMTYSIYSLVKPRDVCAANNSCCSVKVRMWYSLQISSINKKTWW